MKQTHDENLWTAFEAAAATGGALCARGGAPDEWSAEDWSACDVAIDPARVKPGDMFVALRDAREGNAFLKSVFEAGAAAALIARAPEDAPDGAPLLVVSDTLQGLLDLAEAARTRNFGKRLAAFGAGVGGLCDILAAALGGDGKAYLAEQQAQPVLSAPLGLARFPMHARYGVFAMDARASGVVGAAARLVRPHCAVIGGISPHGDRALGAPQNLAQEIVDGLSGLAPGAVVILPHDDMYFEALKAAAEKAGAAGFFSYGEGEGADFRLRDFHPAAIGGRVEAQIFGRNRSFSIGLADRRGALECLAALGVVKALGADRDAAMSAIETFLPAPGRGARSPIARAGGQALLIDESASGDAASMAGAIKALGEISLARAARRIAILGHMAPPPSPDGLNALANLLVAAGVDRVFITGEPLRPLWDRLPDGMRGLYAGAAVGLFGSVEDAIRPGDIVLIKGEAGSGLSALVRALKQREQQKEESAS